VRALESDRGLKSCPNMTMAMTLQLYPADDLYFGKSIGDEDQSIQQSRSRLCSSTMTHRPRTKIPTNLASFGSYCLAFFVLYNDSIFIFFFKFCSSNSKCCPNPYCEATIRKGPPTVLVLIKTRKSTK
jgi:hypothetical protein